MKVEFVDIEQIERDVEVLKKVFYDMMTRRDWQQYRDFVALQLDDVKPEKALEELKREFDRYCKWLIKEAKQAGDEMRLLIGSTVSMICFDFMTTPLTIYTGVCVLCEVLHRLKKLEEWRKAQ